MTRARTKSRAAVEIFTFGDPEPVLERRQLFELFETTHNGRWYEPPVPPTQLGQLFSAMSSHHQSAILLKRDMLAGAFAPSRWLSRADFARWVLDWLIFGNAYMERVDNNAGRLLSLRPSPAAYTRVGVKPDQFWFLLGKQASVIRQAHEFRPGTVHHLIEPDPLQEIYGQPQYMSSLHSGLLNEAATLFRRKYFKNGAHLGFVLVNTSETMSDKDSDAIREALRQGKGAGNFRNLYLHVPKGTKDTVDIKPIGEVSAKDDFLNIKEITGQDMMISHRTPPILVAQMPKNTGGFGNVLDATDVFYELVIMPIQQRLLELNDWLGLEAVRFNPRPERSSGTGQARIAPAI